MVKRKDVLRYPRFAGQVKRYHTWPTLYQDTVGEHTFQVMRIYMEIFGPMPAAVANFIMVHDIDEISTGDIPFPVKANNPEIRDAIGYVGSTHMINNIPWLNMDHPITDEDRVRVKFCDLLEMWEFGMQDLFMGNMLAQPIVDDTLKSAMSLMEEEENVFSPHDYGISSYFARASHIYDIGPIILPWTSEEIPFDN